MSHSPKNLNSPVLESAWQRYAEYDSNARLATMQYKYYRKFALGLAMLAVILAVFSSDIAQIAPLYCLGSMGRLTVAGD